MKAFRAIVMQTVRSAVRSRVFIVLGFLIALAVFLLPLTVAGDGTAMGQLQIALTYSLGVVVALISTTTLWLSCALLSREIENYSLHMVTTKPVGRWLIWVSKWFGVFIMHAVILAVSAAVILALVLYRVRSGDFSEDELQQLRSEVMVGRRGFRPERPDFSAMAQEEYQQRLPELDQAHDPEVVKTEILRQLVAKSGDVPPGAQRIWVFRNINVRDEEEPLFLRYRMYAGSTSQSEQEEMPGLWIIRDPNSTDQERFIPFPQKALSGTFHELRIDPRFVDENNRLVIGYVNPPPGAQEWGRMQPESAIFQISDGPTLLLRVTGFSANYARSIVLAMLQIGFLAALGCMVGAAFSTPVAAFVAISYLVIGMTVRAAVDAPIRDQFGNYQYKGPVEMVAHRVAQGIGTVVVSVNDLDATSDLARGRLIEWRRIGKNVFWLLLVRGGIVAGGLGVWVLTRRELGAVIRK